MQRKIFFVDDEQRVVDGLRRMLRSMRNEWDMQFFESGPAALEAMTDVQPDIVISDMRMPGRDGAQFLEQLRRRWPATIRLILSGQCERAAVLDAAGPAHQFLSKPCNAEELRRTICRIFEIRDQLANAEIRTIVSQVTALPISRYRRQQMAELLTQPKIPEATLIELIHADVALLSKCLQLITGGFLGSQQELIPVADMVRMIGADSLRSLILERKTLPSMPNDPLIMSLDALFHKVSRVTGEVARQILAEEKASEQAQLEAEFGGRLARIGVALLGLIDPFKYLHVWRIAAAQKVARTELEMRIYGVHRANVGAYLLGLWGVPSRLVDVILNAPWPGRYNEAEMSTVTAVHAACALVDQALFHETEPSYRLDLDHLRRIGMEGRLVRWRELAQTMAQSVSITPAETLWGTENVPTVPGESATNVMVLQEMPS